MKEEIRTPYAPKAIGPYSQAIISDNLVFISGQIALDPKTQEFVGQDIAAQTIRVLKNILAILEQAGLTLQNIIRTEIYLTNMDDFSILNEVYGQFFDGVFPKPARMTIQVVALPKGAKVEISAIARIQ